MKYLQDLHNKILDNKVGRSTFLKESRKMFPNLINTYQSFDNVVQVLIKKGYLKEYLSKDYVNQHEFHIGCEYERDNCTPLEKIEETVLRNITKDRNFYTNLLAEQSPISNEKVRDKIFVVGGRNAIFTKGMLSETIKKEVQKFKYKKLLEGIEDGSFLEEEVPMTNNLPEYEFYCTGKVDGKTKIIKGFKYRDDATKFKNHYSHNPIQVVAKSFLTGKGVNPDDNRFWGIANDLEELKTNLMEDQENIFHEEKESILDTSPQLQTLNKDIQRAISNNKEFKGLYDSAWSFAEQKDSEWKNIMQTLAKKLYGYLASVKEYVDTVAHGSLDPIVKILTTSHTLNESIKYPKLTEIFKK